MGHSIAGIGSQSAYYIDQVGNYRGGGRLGASAGTGLNLTVTAGPGAEMRRAMQEQMRPQGRGGSGGRIWQRALVAGAGL